MNALTRLGPRSDSLPANLIFCSRKSTSSTSSNAVASGTLSGKGETVARIELKFREMTVLAGMLALLPLTAGNLPAGKPEEAGMSAERLQRINQAMQRHIDAGAISGAVTLVARNGRIVHFEAHGVMDIESKKPMSKDTLFRIASMTKPITGVAVMMMVEEGKIRLSDPVSKFIP